MNHFGMFLYVFEIVVCDLWLECRLGSLFQVSIPHQGGGHGQNKSSVPRAASVATLHHQSTIAAACDVRPLPWLPSTLALHSRPTAILCCSFGSALVDCTSPLDTLNPNLIGVGGGWGWGW